MSEDKIKARCFGRDKEDSGKSRPPRSLNAVKDFVLSVVNASQHDFVMSCCIATSHVLNMHPELVFILARNPSNIAKRYAGCRYDKSRGLFLANIHRSPITIMVAGDGYMYARYFAETAIVNHNTTPDGIPVMSESDYVTAALHAKYVLPEFYKKFFVPQGSSSVISRILKMRCGTPKHGTWAI